MLLLVIRFWVKLIDFAICGHSLLRLYFILVASVIMSRLPKITHSPGQTFDLQFVPTSKILVQSC